MPVSIKICGLTDEAAIDAVIASKAAFAGFIFFPASPRHIPLKQAAKLRHRLPDSINAVSVVVDPDDAFLNELEYLVEPEFLQLHGHESPDRVREIRSMFPHLKIIKAIRVRNADDVAQSMAYSQCADILLFDAKPPEVPGILPGGNGLSFDWALLANREFPLPWMLSGGLNASNVGEAIRHTGTKMVDVSSGVEKSPGVKDAALIKAFVEAVKSV